MKPSSYIGAFVIVVPDYDAAIAFYTDALGFDLIEDTDQGDGKRWVLVAPPGSRETRILLAKSVTPEQDNAIGNQTGGRVGFFLNTSAFSATYEFMRDAGVHFEEAPRHEPYGIVAVFQDPFGNRWDLIEPRG